MLITALWCPSLPHTELNVSLIGPVATIFNNYLTLLHFIKQSLKTDVDFRQTENIKTVHNQNHTSDRII